MVVLFLSVIRQFRYTPLFYQPHIMAGQRPVGKPTTETERWDFFVRADQAGRLCKYAECGFRTKSS